MKVVRFIVGVIGFLLVWFVVAMVISFGLNVLFPRADGVVMAGVGMNDWRNAVGSFLGLLAGLQSFYRSTREPAKKEKPETSTGPT